MTTSAQIGAWLDTVLNRDPDAQAIAIRAEVKGDWPNRVSRRGRVFDLRWCESRLALREALEQHAGLAPEPEPKPGLLAMTPLNDSELPNDIAARLSRGRVFQPEGWAMVRDLFKATETDVRLGRYDWMPEVLVEAAGAAGFLPLPSGFLDLESAWREVLRGALHLADARPDAVTLMRWAMRPDLPVLLGRLPAKAHADALDWLAASGGAAAGLVVRCIRSGRAADAAPLGLVCDVIFAKAAEGEASLAQAAVRLERYISDHHVTVEEGRRWATEARRLAEHTPPEDIRPVLDRADALLRELKVADHAHLSDWLPSGLERRLDGLAQAIDARLTQPGESALMAAEAAAQVALGHRLIPLQPLRAERVRMAVRLLRWLQRPGSIASGLTALAERHADEAAFVDWARFRLLGGDDLPDLSEAFRHLRTVVMERRDAMNKAFAAALALQVTEAAATGPRVVPVEDVLTRVVGPLASSHPVLLLVIDGLSVAIFRELFDRPERHGWSEAMPEQADRPLVALAALPTVTEVSRTSLLMGRLALGAAPNEKLGFASHAALVAASSSSHPPRLFHKGGLSDGGNLSGEVRAALANPSQHVVGVVYNAVDDHLSGPDQLHQRWSLDDLRLLQPLLKEARDSRRLVIVTADHGHMLEEESARMAGGENDRWRAGHAAAFSSEVALAGSRVLAPTGGQAVVCLWSDVTRYTGRKNGYHGGASPAEAVVPLSVLTPFGVNVPGWKLAPPQQPHWWDAPGSAVPPVLPVASAAKPSARKAAKAPAGQGGLFGEADLPVPSGPTVDWVTALFASSVYASQRQLAARVALPDDLMRRLLQALDDRGGKLSRAALAQRLGLAEMRLGGVLSAGRRVLNVDQAPVLSVDEASGTVELNRTLLARQFRLQLPGATA